ncbi:MAG: adenosylcobinamide-GDP ribazoletransferase [Dehalococcoidia bacterium]
MPFLIAIQLLTIVPIKYGRQYSPAEMGRSLAFFPIVGLLIGLLLWGLDLLLTLFLPVMLVNVLLFAVLAIVTGALHLDGFIDTCDGLAARGSRSEKLEAMKDSGVGAVGVVAVCFMLLAQIASFSALPDGTRVSALIAMPLLSRWTMACAVWTFPPARREGLGWAVRQQASWKGILIAVILTLGISWVVVGWWGILLVGGLTIIALALGQYLSATFGGLSGDTYGAINEVTQLGALVFIYIISTYSGAFPGGVIPLIS